MKRADASALQEALKASQEEALKASRAEVRRATGLPDSPVDPRKAQEDLTKRAVASLNRKGYQPVNTRNCAPNCLLVALLQHAIGQYVEQLSSSFSTKVTQWRNALVRESQERCDSGERRAAIKTDERLHADDPLIPWLAGEILGNHVRVDFYCADADGNAVNFHSIGEGARSVGIFDCGGTFKALIPTRSGKHREPIGSRA